MKYLISEDHLDSILRLLSNHPKRHMYLKSICSDLDLTAHSPCRQQLIPFPRASSCLHLVIGDSHGEFYTRDHYHCTPANWEKNILACYHTGATTLLGALYSTSYLKSAALSANAIVNALDMLGGVERVHLSLSLGEIDLRTKIYMEALRCTGEVPSEELLLDTQFRLYRTRLSDCMNSLRELVEGHFGQRMGRLSLLMPPPPSPALPGHLPATINEAIHLISITRYPRFGSHKSRLALWKSLCSMFEVAAKENQLTFLSNSLYSQRQCLDMRWSNDGCHVDKGDAALLNSYIALRLR